MPSVASVSLADLFARLSTIHPLSEKLEHALSECIQVECLPARTLLLREGQTCERVYYLESGLVRGYYLMDGEDITSWFMSEGHWMLSVGSFFDQEPGEEFIELLEETTLLSIHHQALQGIYQQFPEFNFIGRVLTERYYRLSEKRIRSLRRQTALDRYHHLLATDPALFSRARQQDIASFLGMKPETLSRLRNRKSQSSH